MNHDEAGNPGKMRKAVIARELEWHEKEVRRRDTLDKILYGPPAFDTVVQSGFNFLQIKAGDLVLDLGCGEGKETLALGLQGSTVVSVDLSYAQLSRALQLLREHRPDAKVYFVQANAEELPFASACFRIIYGKAILHHLDLDRSASEVRRLLKPGGRAAFAEPMEHHPLFWAARRLTPHLRTQDERPLTFDEFQRFKSYFSPSVIEAFFLLAPLAYLFRVLPYGETLFQRVHTFLRHVDDWLFRKIPYLKKIAWYGIVKFKAE